MSIEKSHQRCISMCNIHDKCTDYFPAGEEDDAGTGNLIDSVRRALTCKDKLTSGFRKGYISVRRMNSVCML